MSAPARTRRQKVEDRERAILSAARAVFVEAGFDGARVAEIGRRAGIAEGTVYLYYRNKSELMAGVLDAFWADLTRDAQMAVAAIEAPATQLRTLAVFHLDRLIEEHPFLDLAATLRQIGGRDPGLRQQMRDYFGVFDDICQRCLDQGLARRAAPVWVTRDLFFGTLEYSARTILQGDARAAGEVVDNLMALILAEDA